MTAGIVSESKTVKGMKTDTVPAFFIPVGNEPNEYACIESVDFCGRRVKQPCQYGFANGVGGTVTFVVKIGIKVLIFGKTCANIFLVKTLVFVKQTYLTVRNVEKRGREREGIWKKQSIMW